MATVFKLSDNVAAFKATLELKETESDARYFDMFFNAYYETGKDFGHVHLNFHCIFRIFSSHKLLSAKRSSSTKTMAWPYSNTTKNSIPF